MKRKLRSPAAAEASSFSRKQRSQISRRRRLHISPVLFAASIDSHFDEVSCDSSIASVISRRNPPQNNNDEFGRVITRSYYRKRFRNHGKICDESVEVSENSCVESCSGVNGEVNAAAAAAAAAASAKEFEFEAESVKEVTKSEVSNASRFSVCESDAGKVNEAESSIRIAPNNDAAFVVPAHVQKTNLEAEYVKNDGVSENSAAAVLRVPKKLVGGVDLDLTCSEQFSNGGVINGGEEEEETEEEYSSSSPDIFGVYTDSEFRSSECTPSFCSYDSGSQFSEKSVEGSSPTFELFRQFKEHFCRSTFALKAYDDHSSRELIVLGLENEEDEESYRLMRKRERRQGDVHDYAEEYCITTAYGDLVIQQRLHMVHWIIEQATSRDLQKETMFLGVSLFDRFLSKGYFRDIGKLQIAGIACLTLATRIEENQPYNSLRKRTFYVGNATYARCEVVAMEWLVQEVLNFQCCRPTLYNFLWFYLKAAKANATVEKTTKYLAVLTLMGHQQLCFWPSTVAAGLVILASIAANQDASCRLVTGIHARHKDDDLPECIKSLEWLVKYL